jgi:hypothetical protein
MHCFFELQASLYYFNIDAVEIHHPVDYSMILLEIYHEYLQQLHLSTCCRSTSLYARIEPMPVDAVTRVF